jgi:serine/threonine protein kinase
MSEKIGHFEVVSQLGQSSFATVYKAVDTDSQQAVALKVVRLDALKDRATLLKTVFEEAERAKPLNSHNIAALYGVGDEADLLLASAEYVQGNSVATTLARHESFSIWDVQDIIRQVCQGLDHAHGHKVVHLSLEPAKIMVQWDGLVKVLGFGMSTMNAGTAAAIDGIPEILHYASPEQLRGETCDHRSVIFSLGAILYEMAAEQKAFAGTTSEEVRTAILESTPPLPHRLKAKVNPALSSLIMKAIAKSPEERFQSGQELVREMEQLKSGSSIVGSVPLATKTSPAPPREMPKAVAAAAGATGLPKSVMPAAPKIAASAAPAEVEEKPSFAVDPMMAGASAPVETPAKSFSDISELPPLREVRIDPLPPPADLQAEEEIAPEPLPAGVFRKAEPEKPKVQVREVAQKAVREIRKTPPKLYMYAIGGAVALIGLFIGGFSLYNYFQDRDSGNETSSVTQPTVQPNPIASPKPAQPLAPPVAATTTPEQPERDDSQATSSPAPSTPRGRRGKARTAAPTITPAQINVSSIPEGAEISFDGSTLCQTPCTLTGIAPGQHAISAGKAGFAAASRTVSLQSGANTTVVLQLSQLTAILSVSSNPAGAAIVIDGKDIGKLTPSQIILDKPGKHAITLKRYGYLEGSSSVNVELGQTSNLNLELTHLGNTEEIRAAGGKFKKVFGRGDASGMGIVSVKTQPKGAQIMVNNRVLDKTAPFDFYLNPGTYVIDITMSGYRSLHRVVSIQEGEKLAIEESLIPE